MYYIFTNKPGQKSLTFNPIINSLFYLNCIAQNIVETQVIKKNYKNYEKIIKKIK